MQFALIRQFDADLADVIGAFVVRDLVPIGDPFDILVVDAADIADHVRRDIGEWVLAKEACLDLHAGKAVAMNGETGDFLVG